MLLFTNKLIKIAFSNINKNQKLVTNLRKYSTIKDNTVQIGSQTISYVKVGNGPHKVFCCPGALGTKWSDFKPQIKKLDRTKFTVIAWDPPGYGFSRPPDKVFTKNFYRDDANTAGEFMKAIGVPKFSILGWSDGGISGMIMSAKHPEMVEKLVMWGSSAYVIDWEYQSYQKILDVSKWSESMRAPLVKMYGNDGLQNMWSSWNDALGEIFKNGGDVCKKDLSLIKCPTFILHGDKDPLVAPEHPEYLLKNIANSRLHRFPEGKHNIHLKYADEFNSLVTKFLLE